MRPSSSSTWIQCKMSIDYKNTETNIYAEAGTIAHAKLEQIWETGEMSDDEHVNKVFNMMINDIRLDGEIRVEEICHLYYNLKGTADLVASWDDTLFVGDLKYGMGYVSAYNNSQLRIYALAHLEKCHKNVIFKIYQPRINNYSTETITREELLKWEKEILLPAVNRQHTQWKTGIHCKYCAKCPNYWKEILEWKI